MRPVMLVHCGSLLYDPVPLIPTYAPSATLGSRRVTQFRKYSLPYPLDKANAVIDAGCTQHIVSISPDAAQKVMDW
jgi:hypothetical protein